VAGLRDVLGGAPAIAATLVPLSDRRKWLSEIFARIDKPPVACDRDAMRNFARTRYSLESSAASYRKLVADLAAGRQVSRPRKGIR
jgi:hypothetical protein